MDGEGEQPPGDDHPAVLIGVLDELDQPVELLRREEVGVVDEDGPVDGAAQRFEVAAQAAGGRIEGVARQPRLAIAGWRLQEDDGGSRRPGDPPQHEGSRQSHSGSTVLNPTARASVEGGGEVVTN